MRSGREYLSITAEARHMKETIAGRKMRLAKNVENEDTWQRCVEVESHRHDKPEPPGHKRQRQRQERNT